MAENSGGQLAASARLLLYRVLLPSDHLVNKKTNLFVVKINNFLMIEHVTHFSVQLINQSGHVASRGDAVGWVAVQLHYIPHPGRDQIRPQSPQAFSYFLPQKGKKTKNIHTFCTMTHALYTEQYFLFGEFLI